MTRRGALSSALAGVALGALVWFGIDLRPPAAWSDAEITMLRTLALDTLPPLPADPSNAVADDPRAAALGLRLFFDTRLSGTGAVSCATCHQPERRFTDGRTKGQAIGTSKRNTRSIVGVAYSPWLYWDGRRDSLWSQALTPLEDPVEHGGDRMRYARLVTTDPGYREAYEALFGPPPDFSDPRRFPAAASPLASAEARAAWQAMAPGDQTLVNRVFANIGKAIAAYERRLALSRARFDDYVAAVVTGDEAAQRRLFSADEVRGLRLFLGAGNCTQCHNGPLLTNHEFHNTGALPAPGEPPDKGRSAGVRTVMADPFNCLGEYNDAPDAVCPELRFARTGSELIGAMRTPSLRNLAGTAPYLHKGQLDSLTAVLDLYNRAPLALIGHNEAKPLGLGRRDLDRLERFLETLEAPVADPASSLAAAP
jgi:cytochrome c peroxidase